MSRGEDIPIRRWSENLGITVRGEKVGAFLRYLRSLDPANLSDLYLLGWIADYPDPNNFMGDAFLGSIAPLPGTQDIRFEEFNARSATELDPAERDRLYAKLEFIMNRKEVHVAALFNFPRLPLVKTYLVFRGADIVHIRDWEVLGH